MNTFYTLWYSDAGWREEYYKNFAEPGPIEVWDE